MFRLSGGRDAYFEPPFLVFTNKTPSYPIRGTPDDVAGVGYRTGPMGWMETPFLPQWLSEERLIMPLENGTRRILFVNNCSGHNETKAMRSSASGIGIDIRYFSSNVTHLIQPCDSFVIQKIKRAYTTHWETWKMYMIRKVMWKDKSGRLVHPGKTLVFKLIANCIRQVNHQRNEHRLQYARKAMILTAMAKIPMDFGK